MPERSASHPVTLGRAFATLRRAFATLRRAFPTPGRASTWLLGSLCVFPVAFLLVLSLSHRWNVPVVLPRGFDASRWLELVAGRGRLAQSLALSVAVSLVVAALATAGGYLSSRAIAYSERRRAWLALAYVPFAFSPVILGTCLLFLAIRAHVAGTVVGVVLAQTLFAYGFAVVFLMSAWTPQRRACEELVYTLGGSSWDAHRRALLPLTAGLLAICFFQTFLISWFQYGVTLLVGSGKVKTLPLLVFDSLREGNVYYAALASCLLALPPLVLLVFNRRFVAEPVR
jgi:putative spermidine/putrescine transport system permease protein